MDVNQHVNNHLTRPRWGRGGEEERGGGGGGGGGGWTAGTFCWKSRASQRIPLLSLGQVRTNASPTATVLGTHSAVRSINVALRSRRPYGLIGTGSPRRLPRLSHSSWALCCPLLQCCFTSTETVHTKPVLNWANCLFVEYTSDSSTNYNSFLNWTFSSPNMVRAVRRIILRS